MQQEGNRQRKSKTPRLGLIERHSDTQRYSDFRLLDIPTGQIRRRLVVIRYELENISRCALQVFADRLQCRKPDSFDFATFEQREILFGDTDLLGEFL